MSSKGKGPSKSQTASVKGSIHPFSGSKHVSMKTIKKRQARANSNEKSLSIGKTAIINMCRKSGILRIEAPAVAAIPKLCRDTIEKVITPAVILANHADRKTIVLRDVAQAASLLGWRALGSFGKKKSRKHLGKNPSSSSEKVEASATSSSSS